MATLAAPAAPPSARDDLYALERLAADAARVVRAINRDSSEPCDDIQMTGTTISLICPLGQKRIRRAARFADRDETLVVFDMDTMRSVAARSGRYACPVSGAISAAHHLREDAYVQHVIDELDAADMADCTRVEVDDLGTWRPLGADESAWRDPVYTFILRRSSALQLTSPTGI